MRDMLRDYLKLAAGAALGAAEEVRRLAESGARELLERSGVDPEELRSRVPEPVQSLAEEVVAVGRNNSELLLGLIRSEAEKAWSRVGDGMVQVGVVLELLERQVRHLQGGDDEDAPAADEPATGPAGPAEPRTARPKPPASRAEQAFPAPGRAAAPRSAPRPVRVVVDEDGATDAAEAAAAAAARRRASVPGLRNAAAKKTSPTSARTLTPGDTPGAKLPAKKAPAEKKAATAKKAATRAAKKAQPTQAVPPVAASAGKPPVKKQTAAKKAPAAKKTAARRSGAAVTEAAVTEAAPVRSAPEPKKAARKSTARKAAPGKPEAHA